MIHQDFDCEKAGFTDGLNLRRRVVHHAGHAVVLALFCLLPILAGPQLFAQYKYPFQNPNLPLEQRVNNIITLMTLQEKIDFLSSQPAVPRLGIEPLDHCEGLHGMAQGGPSNWGQVNPNPTTIFPQAYGLAETWDTDAVHQAGAVEGNEVRYMVQSPKYHRGGLVVFAPNADLGRDPRWGRTEECYGEDPYFNGTMAVALIKGLQGDNPKYWLTASLLKHFFANSNEDDRTSSSSDFDEQLFREYYSVPFRMGFEEGGARCFMTSYNEWNGVPCTVQPVIRQIVMKEWGVDGIITTDGGASPNLVNSQHYYPNMVEAVTGEVKAGINQFLDGSSTRDVRRAVDQGLLTEGDIDQVIRGTLRVFIRLGLLDPPSDVPYASIGRDGKPEPWLGDEHKAIVRTVTRKSIVLLKNSEHLLPLDAAKLGTIAVVGPRADKVLLDWYSGTPPYTVSPLEGIRKRAGQDVQVTSATSDDESVKLAGAADVAIVCVGNDPIGVPGGAWEQVAEPSYGREAVDRKSITLEQEELIKKVYAVNPKTVVVLISSFPYAINWSQEHVPAILHMTQNSQELGNALADVLFGDYSPAGRLVQTWPRSLDQLPPMMDYDIRHGRTYMYFKGEPLYPFGFGLSYTTFEYSNLKAGSAVLAKDGSVTVSVDVTNTGRRAGDEVVQMYVSHLDSQVPRPLKELRGFRRVTLEPGETRTVELPLKGKDLAYWDMAKHEWVVEGDQIEISVGGSSAADSLKTKVRVE
ncbi:MAG: glycoside hydrolase family 3 C-terminal domain-containing protein [Acidobacteriota bacterium]